MLQVKAADHENILLELDDSKSIAEGLRKDVNMVHEQMGRLEEEREREKGELDSRILLLEEEVVTAGMSR